MRGAAVVEVIYYRPDLEVVAGQVMEVTLPPEDRVLSIGGAVPVVAVVAPKLVEAAGQA